MDNYIPLFLTKLLDCDRRDCELLRPTKFSWYFENEAMERPGAVFRYTGTQKRKMGRSRSKWDVRSQYNGTYVMLHALPELMNMYSMQDIFLRF